MRTALKQVGSSCCYVNGCNRPCQGSIVGFGTDTSIPLCTMGTIAAPLTIVKSIFFGTTDKSTGINNQRRQYLISKISTLAS